MIDFNRLNLLTGAYIAGELQRQGLSPEEAAKFYIQQSRSPEAATSFDMSVLDQDDATRTPADLAELEDLTQDQIQKRRGAEVVGEEGYQDKSYDARRDAQQGSAIRLPKDRPANISQLLQEQVDRGDITPGEKDRQARVYDFLVKQGIVIDDDPLGQKALMQDMGLVESRVRMTPRELAARQRTPVVFRQSGTAQIPGPIGDSFEIKVSGNTAPPIIGPSGEAKYITVPKGRYVKARQGETPAGYRAGGRTKKAYVESRPAAGGAGDAAARGESIRRLRIGLGLDQPVTPRDAGILIAPENRDKALKLLGDLELQNNPQEQLRAQQSLARDAVRADVASGAISREAESRSAKLDSEVRRDDNREEIGGKRKFQVDSGGNIGFRSTGPQEYAIIETDGTPVDSGTRDPIMSDSIDRLGSMLAPDSVREVPAGSAAEFILGNYQNDYATAAESSFPAFSVGDSLDGLTAQFEAKGVSIGRPIRTASDLEQISKLYVEKVNSSNRGSDRFWSFDPTGNVQRLNNDPGVTAVLDKLRVRGGARTTVARALYEQELGAAAGIEPKNVDEIRARAGSSLPNIYLGATARMGNTATESPAVGPNIEARAASPGGQKIEGNNVTDAIKKINVDSNRRSQLDAAVKAEEDFQGGKLSPEQRREAVGGILEQFKDEDERGIGRAVQNDARMPLIGAVAGEGDGGNRSVSALYIPPEGRREFKGGKPRQNPDQAAAGQRLKDAITNARAERRMLDLAEGARRGPFEQSGIVQREPGEDLRGSFASEPVTPEYRARAKRSGVNDRPPGRVRTFYPEKGMTTDPFTQPVGTAPTVVSEQEFRPERPKSFGNIQVDDNPVSREGARRRRRPSAINTTADQAPRQSNLGDKIKTYLTENSPEYGSRYRDARRIGGYSALAAGAGSAIAGLIAGERERRQEEEVR